MPKRPVAGRERGGTPEHFMGGSWLLLHFIWKGQVEDDKLLSANIALAGNLCERTVRVGSMSVKDNQTQLHLVESAWGYLSFFPPRGNIARWLPPRRLLHDCPAGNCKHQAGSAAPSSPPVR